MLAYLGSLTRICTEINEEWKWECGCLWRPWRMWASRPREKTDQAVAMLRCQHPDLVANSWAQTARPILLLTHNPVTRPLWGHESARAHTHIHTHIHTHTPFCSFVIKARSGAYKAEATHIKRFHCSSETLGQGWKWILTWHPGRTAGLKLWYHA